MRKQVTSALPRNGLVLEALLDGNVLDTNDGTKSTLTATNVSYSTSTVGYQKQWGVFNGSSSKITLPSISLTTEWDFSLAFKVTSLASSFVLFDKDNTTTQRVFTVQYYSVDNKLHMYCWNSSGTFYDCATAAGILTVGKEYLLNCRWDNTSNTIKIVLNNVEVASLSKTGNCQNYTQQMTIGAQNGGSGNFTPGNIGTVRLFNRARSEQERQAEWQEFNRQLAGGTDIGIAIPSFSALWDFNGDACNVIAGTKDTDANVTWGQSDPMGLPVAALFNGSNSKIDLSFSANPITGNQYFLSGVFKTPSSFPGANKDIIFWGNSSDNADVEINFDSSNNLRFSTYNGTTQANISFGALSTSTWYAFVAVGNGTSGSFYVAPVGGSYTKVTGTINSLTPGYDRCAIGYHRNANANYYNGSVSIFGVGNGTISDAQAQAIINLLSKRLVYSFHKSLPLSILSKSVLYIPGIISGTNIPDLNGNYNSTAIGSPTSVRVLQNNALVLNGSNTAASLSDDILQLTGDMTFSIWMNKSSAQATLVPIIFANDYIPASGASYGWRFSLDYTTGTFPQMEFYNGTTNGVNYTIASNISCVDSRWNMWSFVKKGTTFYIYRNARLVTSGAGGNPVFNTSGNKVRLGCEYYYGSGANRSFISALLGDAYLTDHAMSQEELQSLMYSTYRQ